MVTYRFIDPIYAGAGVVVEVLEGGVQGVLQVLHAKIRNTVRFIKYSQNYTSVKVSSVTKMKDFLGPGCNFAKRF